MSSDIKQSKKKNKGKERVVLIDTHAVLHRAYHALPAFSTASGQPTGALYGLATMLTKLISDLEPDHIVACYDLPEPTHRHNVYEDYKGTRGNSDEELVLQIKESKRIFDAFSIPVYEAVGFEADDLLGTIADQFRDRDDIEVIIASGDMDTMQLVNNDTTKVYTMKSGIKETVMYDESAVYERFGFAPEYLPDFKGLAGDSSDNIPGIRGVGEKTATALITHFGHIEDMYKVLKNNRDAFADAGIKERIVGLLEAGKDEAEFSKMLATIRCDAPISFKLPTTRWIDRLDIANARDIFRGYEFRNLDDRLADVVNMERIQSAGDKVEATISNNDRAELTIMLWLYDSNLTSPTIKDVFSATGATTVEEARTTLTQRLNERNLLHVFEEIEQPIISLVRQMRERGIQVNRKCLEKLSKEYHEKLDHIEQTIYNQAGTEFNINSPKQLGEVLFDTLNLSVKNHKKTSTGRRSTAESELRKLAGEHPVIDNILKHRELSKLLSSYIDAIPKELDREDVLHAEFLQAGTTTGRMASQHPNLQNIPIRSENGERIRNAFVARDGFKLLALDYSQIELRVVAFLSGDEKLITTFKKGEDIHTSVASEVFEVARERVDKDMRRKAKAINFGILYGMGVNALKKSLGTDRKEAQQFYNAYFEKFEGLTTYIEHVKKIAHEQGYTETYFDRRRYFEGINSSVSHIRANAERMAINAPVQGTAADILKIAMRDVDRWIKEMGYQEHIHCLLQVHDELIYEVSTNFIETVAGPVKTLMENVMTIEETNGVPLLVESEAGLSWGNLKPIV